MQQAEHIFALLQGLIGHRRRRRPRLLLMQLQRHLRYEELHDPVLIQLRLGPAPRTARRINSASQAQLGESAARARA